jgi:hypothetical protein
MRSMACLVAIAASAAPALAAPPSAEEAIAAQVRGFADPTADLKLPGHEQDDKVLFLGRNDKGEAMVVGLGLLPAGQTPDELAPGTLALLRTRRSSPRGNTVPDPVDVALAAKTGVPLFVVGLWHKPSVIWEILPGANGAQIRTIDAKGVAGSWRPLTP